MKKRKFYIYLIINVLTLYPWGSIEGRFKVITSSVIPEALASDHRPVMVLGSLQ